MGAETFGQWIRRIRGERDVSLREVARRAGITANYLSRIERDLNEGPPSEVVCVRIAGVLELGPESVCRRAGRIPRDRERQILSRSAWLAVLREAQFRKVDPSDILAWVRSK